MCAASESIVAPGGLQEHTGPEETGGPPVAGCRASSKGWNETAPFLSDKKHFQVSKLHYTALVQLCKFQTPEQIPQLQHEETLLGCGGHPRHHLLQHFVIWLLTCILHLRLQWLHIFLHSGTIQWAGSILDLMSKVKLY